MNDLPERVGHYEVTREIGRGGMGVVYQGYDPKLDRPVAIKALSPDFAEDPERLTRFEREARVLASLSHGNIATVYGLEEVEGHRFIVMELVEGQTLGDRLADGPLTITEALSITAQVAAGVEAAHDAGVIHRDLKPGNVMIRPDGAIKVLDFGLAREMPARSSASGSLAGAATVPQPSSISITGQGISLGTPGYMSPEQVRGMAVDRRTDTFALGCILFECLAGRLAFPGQTATDSIAAILEREPEWEALPPGTPPTVQLLLRRCLQKDRRRRLRDVGDARIELEQAIDDPHSTALGLAHAALLGGRTTTRRSRVLTLLPWVLLVGAAGAAGGAWALRPETHIPLRRTTISLPDGATVGRPLAITSDGTLLAMRLNSAEGQQLHLRWLDQLETLPVEGTAGGGGWPFFSPDGQWVAYARFGRLVKMSVRGGPPTTLCDAPRMRGGDWSVDGTIVLAPDTRSGLVVLPDAGGTPEPLTTLDKERDENSHRLPHFLPDGKALIFTATGTWSEGTALHALSLESGERTELIRGGSDGRYVETGHVIFYREGTLMAAPFDADRLVVTGPEVPVLEGIASGGNDSAQYTIATDGTLVYVPGLAEVADERSIIAIDATGSLEPLTAHQRDYQRFALSPDAQRLAVTIDDGTAQRLWIIERDRDLPPRPLTAPDTRIDGFVWSPDGRWLVYSTEESGASHIYRIPSNFTGQPELLHEGQSRQLPLAWSPDGRLIAMIVFGDGPDASDIHVIRLDFFNDTATTEMMVGGDGWQWGPSFSPDGRWLAYISTESGAAEAYVHSVEGEGGSIQISTNSSTGVVWSPQGDELLYRTSREGPAIYTVAVTDEDDRLVPREPRQVVGLPTSVRFGLQLTNEGRFAFIGSSAEGVDSISPVLVQGWFQELRERTAKLE
jgi:serine/threonine-protein kinase